MFHQFSDYTSFQYFVRIQAGDPSAILSSIESDWKKLQPELPFTYSFLDEDVDRFYKSEKRWGNIIGWAGGVSIFLACLGLYGLIALAAVNRTKEVGIRKVLGASIASIAATFQGIPETRNYCDQYGHRYPGILPISGSRIMPTGLISDGGCSLWQDIGLVIAIITVSFSNYPYRNGKPGEKPQNGIKQGRYYYRTPTVSKADNQNWISILSI
jgi:hypothetical protein